MQSIFSVDYLENFSKLREDTANISATKAYYAKRVRVRVSTNRAYKTQSQIVSLKGYIVKTIRKLFSNLIF